MEFSGDRVKTLFSSPSESGVEVRVSLDGPSSSVNKAFVSRASNLISSALFKFSLFKIRMLPSKRLNFDNINCRSLCAVDGGSVRLDEVWEGLSFVGSAISKFSSLQGDGVSRKCWR